jgi:hypothetical protein
MSCVRTIGLILLGVAGARGQMNMPGMNMGNMNMVDMNPASMDLMNMA